MYRFLYKSCLVTATEQYKVENKDMLHIVCSASKGVLLTCMCPRFSLCATELCSVDVAQYASYFFCLSMPRSKDLSQCYYS